MLCSFNHKLAGCIINDCKLLASPLVNIKREGLPTAKSIRINQGELFTTVLSRDFFIKNTKSHVWISAYVQASNNYDVVIKVSAAAVHRTLVKQHVAKSALQQLNGKHFGDVLLGVWSPAPSSLVTVMKDLRKEGYRNLMPRDDECDVLALWGGWMQLVQDTLLPLAKRGVVYCDIRPGWDSTANIMYKSVGQEYHLRLIDYNSLATMDDTCELTRDPKAFHVCYDDRGNP